MADIPEIVGWLLSGMLYLSYAATVVHLVYQPSNEDRLKFLGVIIGFFGIYFFATGKLDWFLYNPNWSFMLTQMVLLVFLAFIGLPMMIDRWLVLGLAALLAFSYFTNTGIAMFLGWIAYIVVVFGFIYSAYKKLSTPSGQLQ